MKTWIKYFLWIIGMCLLQFFVYHLELVAQKAAAAYYHVTPEIWISSVAPFVLGMYLSLLFTNRSIRPNIPVLACVFLPSAILGFYFPVAASVHLLIPIWFSKLDTHGFDQIVCGFSLMLGLFNSNIRESSGSTAHHGGTDPLRPTRQYHKEG